MTSSLCLLHVVVPLRKYSEMANLMQQVVSVTWSEVLVFILAVYSMLLCIGKWRKLKDKNGKLPGPMGFPIVGYLPLLNRDAPYESLTQLSKVYGSVFGLNFGSIYTLVICDAKKIRNVLKQEAFTGRPPLFVTNGIMKGYGIVAAEGELWKEQRRFTVSCLRDLGANKFFSDHNYLEDITKKEAQLLIQELLKTNGEPTDVHLLIRTSISHVTASLILGDDFDEDKAEFEHQLDLLDIGSQMVEIIGTLNFLPFLRHVPYFGKLMEKLLHGKEDHHNFLRAVVSRHRSKLTADPPNGGATCLLDAYILEMDRRLKVENVSSFTETQLLHVLADFFGAGLDTIKVTLKWALLFLMHHPQVQSRSQVELDMALEPQQLPSISHLESCPYTRALILEVQRLANVVPLGAPHGTTEDTSLDGYRIPKGTMVIPLLWAIHRDPTLWPDPTAFDPERFLDPEGNVSKPEYFMPFSTGRRSCIGEGMARAVLSLYISSILHNFTLRPEDDCRWDNVDLTPVPGFILSPKPFKISFVPRSNSLK